MQNLNRYYNSLERLGALKSGCEILFMKLSRLKAGAVKVAEKIPDFGAECKGGNAYVAPSHKNGFVHGRGSDRLS